MKIALLALALLSATPLPGLAADDKYIDDRSDAAALVRSLYNAVSRKEYGRAWELFRRPETGQDASTNSSKATPTPRASTWRPAASARKAPRAAPSIRSPSPSRRPTRMATSAYLPAAIPRVLPIRRSRERPSRRCIWKRARSNRPRPTARSSDAVPTSCEGGPPLAATDPIRDQILASFKATYGSSCDSLQPEAEPGRRRSRTACAEVSLLVRPQ